VAISQLAHHPREAVLVFVRIEMTVFAAFGELAQLRGDTPGGNRFELLVSHPLPHEALLGVASRIANIAWIRE